LLLSSFHDRENHVRSSTNPAEDWRLRTGESKDPFQVSVGQSGPIYYSAEGQAVYEQSQKQTGFRLYVNTNLLKFDFSRCGVHNGLPIRSARTVLAGYLDYFLC
jgi:hypothetical protein